MINNIQPAQLNSLWLMTFDLFTRIQRNLSSAEYKFFNKSHSHTSVTPTSRIGYENWHDDWWNDVYNENLRQPAQHLLSIKSPISVQHYNFYNFFHPTHIHQLTQSHFRTFTTQFPQAISLMKVWLHRLTIFYVFLFYFLHDFRAPAHTLTINSRWLMVDLCIWHTNMVPTTSHLANIGMLHWFRRTLTPGQLMTGPHDHRSANMPTCWRSPTSRHTTHISTSTYNILRWVDDITR
jgi:hypothetical protein